MVKGVDLIQLGLMFPPENAVFKQSVNILKSACDTTTSPAKAAIAEQSKQYWFWR